MEIATSVRERSDGLMPAERPPFRYILGMRADMLTRDDIVQRILVMANEGGAHYCCVTNVHQCIMTYDDPAFRVVVNGSDLTVSDSTILRWALWVRYGVKSPLAARGDELMLALCAAAEAENVAVALIGGKNETALATLRSVLLERFPRLNIAFAHSPPFRESNQTESRALIEGLRDSGAKLVFVGLGCPKQEHWMARHKPLVSATMIGVGAAFDFNSGIVKPSPTWVHRAGLEWLHRLTSEPKRLWKRYLTTSPRFVALVALDAIRWPREIR